MNRRDFLKTCFTAIAVAMILNLIKPFRKLTQQHLVEARYYKSSDELLG